MRKQEYNQLSIFESVKTPMTRTEQYAYSCFWMLRLRQCSCPVNWWKWEDQTHRSYGRLHKIAPYPMFAGQAGGEAGAIGIPDSSYE